MIGFLIGVAFGIGISVAVNHRDVLWPEIKRLFGK